MFASTPIYDALAEEVFGPHTDFVPRWLTFRDARYVDPAGTARARHALPGSAALSD